MIHTFNPGHSRPITIPPLQRLAETVQGFLQFDGSRRSPVTTPEPLPPQQSAAPIVFTDRRGAGSLLAAKLSAYANRADVVVVGISEGGISVAAEVSRLLGTP